MILRMFSRSKQKFFQWRLAHTINCQARTCTMICPTEVQERNRIYSRISWTKDSCQNNTAGLEIACAPTIQQRSEFECWLVYAATWITDECPEDSRKIIKTLQEQGPEQTAAKLIFFFQWPWKWEFEIVSQVLFSLHGTIEAVPRSYLEAWNMAELKYCTQWDTKDQIYMTKWKTEVISQ